MLQICIMLQLWKTISVVEKLSTFPLGVVLSGGAIMLTGWTVLDPLISLLVVGAILHGAWPLFKESLDVLLESTPPTISASQVAAAIESLPGVKNVHDLHIWAVEPRLIMLTAHVLVDGDKVEIVVAVGGG